MIDIRKTISEVEPKVGNITFIAVDGRGGSGKSTLAKLLSEKLEAEIIHTDDFSGWDNPLDWWPTVIEKIFQPIEAGATSLTYQPISWWENHHPMPAENQPVTSVMILEGMGSSHKELKDFISLRIFVDTPKKICLQRGIKRDAETGKNKKELKEIWEEWSAKEDTYIKDENPKEKADIILNGTKDFAEQIK